MSAIGKIGVRSGGPAGCIEAGLSGGSGSPGRSAARLTQCVGIASSDRTNFVCSSVMAARPYTSRKVARYGLPMAGAELAPDLADRLAESETLFRSLFDANIVGVLIADRDRVVAANDAFLRIVGRPRAELLAGRLNWAELSPPHTLRTTGEAATWEHDHVPSDGREVPILIGAAPISRSPFRAVCFVLDLTERN